MLLILRADATPEIGSGHVMRCSALAEAWCAAGGEARFITHCPHPEMLPAMKRTGAEVTSIEAEGDGLKLLECLRRPDEAAVVLDGYHFQPTDHKQIRDLGFTLAVVDDMAHLPCYSAHVIVNQNIDATERSYRSESNTRMLLGPTYAMLRSQFSSYAEKPKLICPQVRNVLVTMGGSDPQNFTSKLMESLRKMEGIELTIVVGALNPNLEGLRSSAAQDSKIRLVVNASDMPSLMAEADLSITAAGSTCWELAAMGTPMIVAILAENQRGVAEGLVAAGVAQGIGEADEMSVGRMLSAVEGLRSAPDCRRRMSQRGRQLVDGKGAARVAAALRATVCEKASQRASRQRASYG